MTSVMSKMWMVSSAYENAQALKWHDNGMWSDRDYAVLMRKGLAAFDVAACADDDQPAHPGADSDPAIF